MLGSVGAHSVVVESFRVIEFRGTKLAFQLVAGRRHLGRRENGIRAGL